VNDRRKIYFRINVRFRLGFASSLSATVNESKKTGTRYLVDGVCVCASSDLCVSSLKVESVNPCTEAMIRRRRADSVRRAARRWRGSKKNFSKKLKNFLSIFHPLWRTMHLLYKEEGHGTSEMAKIF
jgi:hypothetical protein